MHLEIFESQKSRDWGSEHIDDLVDIVHVFSNGAVGSTKSTHAHLFGDGLPIVQICTEKDRIRRALSVEAQIPEVRSDQSTLSCLVEAELNNLWPVLRSPQIVDLLD